MTNVMTVPPSTMGDKLTVPNVLEPVQTVCKEFIEKS